MYNKYSRLTEIHRQHPLVVDPVIGNVWFSKVLMDGGSSLNIL
jgi:hypothetical protein